MLDSYIRRQNWLQRNQAAHVINAYDEALAAGKKGGRGGAAHNGSSDAEKVPADQLLAMMGAKVVTG